MAEEFKIKVEADLDTSAAEKKLDSLAKNKTKINLEVDSSALDKGLNSVKDKEIHVKTKVSDNGLKNVSKDIDSVQKSANNLNTSFKNIAGISLGYETFRFIADQAKNAVEQVKALNDAMTTVNMTMLDMPDYKFKDLSRASLDMANNLSTYTATVTDAVKIYANANESIEGILAKAQPTILLASAAKMDTSKAADTIQGILNQFKLADSNAMDVADTIERLSSEIAVDFQKGIGTISEAIGVSGSVMDEAGMSFEKYASIVSATAEETRQSGNVLGNAYKTIASRITRSKDGEVSATEKANAEKAFNSVGISIRDANGEFRDLSDSLDDLNGVWGNLDNVQRSYIAEQAAGVRQKNIFLATMNTYNRALELEKSALDSSGTAMKINEVRANSIDGKLQKLSSTMTHLYTDVISEEAIKGTIDFANGVAEVADSFGLLQGAIAGLATAGIISSITSLWSKFAVALKNPATIASLGIGAAVAAYSAYQNSIKKMIADATDAGNAWAQSNDSLQTNIDKIMELRDALESGSLTEQEAYDTKSQLLSIQESLTESYGSQVAGIDLINGSLTEQIALLDQVSQKEADNFLNENKKGIKKAVDEMESNRHTYLGQFYDNGSEESEAIKKAIGKLQAEYGEEVFKIDQGTDGITMDVHFNADATTAKGALNDFMTEISNIEDFYGESNVIDSLSDYAFAGLNEAKDVLKTYQELYDQALNAKLVSDEDMFKAPDGKEQTAIKWLNDYTKAVKAYNKALSEGDADKISETAAEFSAVDAGVQKLLNNSDMSKYAEQFGDVRDELNEAAISSNKFKNALAGDDVSKFGKSVTDSVNAIKDLNMTDTDFKYAFETDGIQAGEDAVQSLVSAAIDCGFISDTSSGQVNKLVGILSTLGIVSSETIGNLDGVSEAIVDMSTQIEAADSTLAGIQATASLLNSQSTGKSISLADFNSDELEGYTAALEYNNGALQLNAQKLHELQKAKADEAIQSNDNLKLEKQSQYMKNISEIESLQDRLRKLTDAKSSNTSAIQESIDALLSENDSIVNQCSQLDLMSSSLREATGAYQAWLDSQNAGESGDMFDDTLGAMEQIDSVTRDTESEDYGKIGLKRYEAAIDLVVPDTIDSDDASAVKSYIDSIGNYFTYDENGGKAGLNIEEFCQQAMSKGLMVLDEESQEYKVAGQRTMEDFADGLNLSLPMVQAMFGEMEEYGAEFNWSDEGIKTLGDLGMAAGEAKSRIEELADNENLDIQIDVSDIEATEDKLTVLDNTISQMQELKARPEIDATSVDDANAIIQYCITQKQRLETPAVLSVNASNIEGELSNAISLLQEFQAVQNAQELQAAVGADTSEAQSKVDGLVSEIQGLDPEIQTKLNIDTASADTIVASIKSLTPEILVKAGVDPSEVEAYQNQKHDSSGIVKWGNDTAIVDSWASQMHRSDGTVYWDNNTSGVKTSFTAPGFIEWKNTSGPQKSNVSGTAHANGTAYPHLVGYANARGNWGSKTSGVALVGELGREIIVDPQNGTWQTIGDNGAEFKYIPAGSIVFNHKQSEALLERGFVNSRGKAYASGTAMVTGGISVSQANKRPSNVHTSWNSSTQNTVQHAAQTVNKAANDTSKDIKDMTDFVEIRIKRLADKTEEYITNAESGSTLSYILSNYSKAISNISREIKANQQGEKKYRAQANAVGLDENIAKKVRDGSIEINKYDENTRTKIEEYQKYYENALQCQKTITELHIKEKELLQKRLDSIADIYDKRLNNASLKADRLEAELNFRETAGYSQYGNRQKNIYKTAIENEKYTYDKTKQAANAYYKEYLQQVKSGKLKKGSKEWEEAVSQLKQYDQTLYDSMIAQEEYAQKLRQLPITKLEYALNALSRWSNQLKSIFNLKTARGERLTETDYRKQATSNNDEINKQYELLKKYQKEMSNYEYGSEAWEEWAEKAADAKNNILDLLAANEELKDSIMETRWKEFDDLHDQVDRSMTEIEFLRGMLNDLKVDEDGNLTGAGKANIALIGQGMAMNKQTIADYTAAIKKLDEQYANGCYSQDEYNEKLNEYLGIIRDAASANHDYEQELIDMYIERITAQNDALQDEIDLRKEALKRKEEYYDYDKKLRKKTKDIQSLQAQAAALEGVSTAAGKAKLAKIKAELGEAQDDLDDILHDHEYEFRMTGYEDFAKDVQEQLDKAINAVKTNSEEQQRVVSEMLNSITNNYSSAYSEINTLINHTGVVFSENTSAMINGMQGVVESARLAAEALKDVQKYTPSNGANNVDTGKVDIDKDSNGNSTGNAENGANQPEDSSNAKPNLPNSNQSAVTRPKSITLNKTAVTINAGATCKLTVTTDPKNATVVLTWKSSNTKIATVSGGTVKGVAAGSATITATDTGTGKKATCKVTVKGKAASNTGSSGSSNPDIWNGIAKDSSDKGNKNLDLNNSIYDYIAYCGYSPSYASQKKLYSNLGGEKVHGTYSGTATQNTWMVQQLKKKGYKNGTTNATRGVHLIDEEGDELVRSKYGHLMNFEGGEHVFDARRTDNLYQMAEISPADLQSTIEMARRCASYALDNSVQNFGDTYNNYIDKVEGVHVDGSVDDSNLKDVQSVGKSLLQDRKFVNGMIKKVDKKFSEDATKYGIVRRVR